MTKSYAVAFCRSAWQVQMPDEVAGIMLARVSDLAKTAASARCGIHARAIAGLRVWRVGGWRLLYVVAHNLRAVFVVAFLPRPESRAHAAGIPSTRASRPADDTKFENEKSAFLSFEAQKQEAAEWTPAPETRS